MTQRKGIISFYDKTNLKGFIKDENGQKIRFQHEASLALKLNDLVYYYIVMMESGLTAVNITLILEDFGSTFRFVKPKEA